MYGSTFEHQMPLAMDFPQVPYNSICNIVLLVVLEFRVLHLGLGCRPDCGNRHTIKRVVIRALMARTIGAVLHSGGDVVHIGWGPDGGMMV